MKKNKLALITLIVLFFQILFVESLVINAIRPDFLVLFIIYITISNGRLIGLIIGFTIGLISDVMALGLNIQWGYAGLFNAGVMGFAAIGAIACVLISMPWVSDVMQIGLEDLLKSSEDQKKSITALQLDLSRRLVAEQQIGIAWVIGAMSALVAWLMNRLLRYRVPSWIRIVLVVVVLSIVVVVLSVVVLSVPSVLLLLSACCKNIFLR